MRAAERLAHLKRIDNKTSPFWMGAPDPVAC